MSECFSNPLLKLQTSKALFPQYFLFFILSSPVIHKVTLCFCALIEKKKKASIMFIICKITGSYFLLAHLYKLLFCIVEYFHAGFQNL